MPKPLPLVSPQDVACCTPLGSQAEDPIGNAEILAMQLRALGEPQRVRIVQELSCCEGHRMSTRSIAEFLGVTEATASHHVKNLERAGVLAAQRDGRTVWYTLNLGSLRSLAHMMNVSCNANCQCA